MALFSSKSAPPEPSEALPGRDTPMVVPDFHFVNGNPLQEPFPDGLEKATFGMGCFWGAERIFWELPGVYTTAVGYAAGQTPNPNYQEVCSGRTGHAEVVLVAFDPEQTSYDELLRVFWNRMIQPRGCGRATTWAASIAPEYIFTTTRNARPPSDRCVSINLASKSPATAQLRPRSKRHHRFITPRITISSIWPRILAVIVELVGPGWLVRGRRQRSGSD